MTQYELSRNWFDWCFENPEKVTPTHTAMYFFIIEHCNRLGWKEKFGLPMEMTKDAIGIKNYRTFTKVFTDLVNWDFIIVHQRSKNQYSSNVIAIAQNTKANTKALDKALHKQLQKQVHGIVGINKPFNQEHINTLTGNGRERFAENYKNSKEDLEVCFLNDENWIATLLEKNPVIKSELQLKEFMTEFCNVLDEANQFPLTLKEASNRFRGWLTKHVKTLKSEVKTLTYSPGDSKDDKRKKLKAQ